MHGYGEFLWKDGKRYIGFYAKDKKEGFGIYYWSNPNRAYIGFWKNGKQDGIGKYINPKSTKYGLWSKGERVKWFTSENDAYNTIENSQFCYLKMFSFDLSDIVTFLS